MKREQVVTTIGELIEAKTEVANIVVDVLSSERFVLLICDKLFGVFGYVNAPACLFSCGHRDEPR